MLSSPRFNTSNRSFQTELKNRVDAYFAEKGIASTGNYQLYLKSFILSLTFIAIYGALVFASLNVWVAIVLAMLLGVNVAAIGFNVMHDGAHGSYSKSSLVNQLAASSLDFLGGSSFMWKVKHNIIHHTFSIFISFCYTRFCICCGWVLWIFRNIFLKKWATILLKILAGKTS
jgi:linoleoyl-CoA desaturase